LLEQLVQLLLRQLGSEGLCRRLAGRTGADRTGRPKLRLLLELLRLLLLSRLLELLLLRRLLKLLPRLLLELLELLLRLLLRLLLLLEELLLCLLQGSERFPLECLIAALQLRCGCWLLLSGSELLLLLLGRKLLLLSGSKLLLSSKLLLLLRGKLLLLLRGELLLGSECLLQVGGQRIDLTVLILVPGESAQRHILSGQLGHRHRRDRLRQELGRGLLLLRGKLLLLLLLLLGGES